MSTTTTAERALDPAIIAHYQREGYAILPYYMPAEALAAVRADCDAEIAKQDADMAARGTQVEGINHHRRRYFIGNTFVQRPALRSWVFSDAMAAVVRAALGGTAQLFLEQLVVKGCDAGTTFGWHQDSGYVGYPHREYLSCWIALDPVDEANGTISVLPYSHASRAGADPRAVCAHQLQDGTNDMIGYHGDDPGIPVVVPAGSLVLFSSRLFHRSGANTTQALRRAWLIQYTAEPLRSASGELRILAEPFLVDGCVAASARLMPRGS